MERVTSDSVSWRCSDPPFLLPYLFRRDRSGGVLSALRTLNIVPCANTRSAIRKACDVMCIGKGDEILAPSYYCGSEIDPLLDTGATVQLYRVDNWARLDLENVKSRISKQTKLVYVTHYFGFPQPDLLALKVLCNENNIYLLEDCALSMFSQIDNQHVGTIGDVSVFCFHKFFPSMGGGGLVVNNPVLEGDHTFNNSPPKDQMFRGITRAIIDSVLGYNFRRSLVRVLTSLLGKTESIPDNSKEKALNFSDESEFSEDIPASYYFDRAHMNTKMNPITKRALGAFSVMQTISQRRENFLYYVERLKHQPELELLIEELPDNVCPHIFPVVVQNRDYLCAALNALNIGCTPWWRGWHRALESNEFPEAIRLKNTVLALPLHQYMSKDHIDFVCHHLCTQIGQSRIDTKTKNKSAN